MTHMLDEQPPRSALECHRLLARLSAPCVVTSFEYAAADRFPVGRTRVRGGQRATTFILACWRFNPQALPTQTPISDDEILGRVVTYLTGGR